MRKQDKKMAVVRTEVRGVYDTCRIEYADTFCRLGEVLLSFSSGVLLLVTFGSSYWLTQRIKNADFHSGLWQNCSAPQSSDCKTLPLTFPQAPGELLAARVFMCVALGSGMSAWVISIVGLLQHRARWLLISAVCYSIQAALMVLGLGSFAKSFSNKLDNYSSSAGWSYSVGWVGFVMTLMCTLYFVSVAVYRICIPSPTSQPGSKMYAPLAQFESTETGSDDDDDL